MASNQPAAMATIRPAWQQSGRSVSTRSTRGIHERHVLIDHAPSVRYPCKEVRIGIVGELQAIDLAVLPCPVERESTTTTRRLVRRAAMECEAVQEHAASSADASGRELSGRLGRGSSAFYRLHPGVFASHDKLSGVRRVSPAMRSWDQLKRAELERHVDQRDPACDHLCTRRKQPVTIVLVKATR